MKHSYSLEIKDLCNRLARAGYTPVEVWQTRSEGAETPTWGDAHKYIMEVDEAQLEISREGVTHTLQIILGNGPGEAVSDYTYTTKTEFDDVIDDVTSEHYAYWDEGIGKLAPPHAPHPVKEHLPAMRKLVEGGHSIEGSTAVDLLDYVGELEDTLTQYGVAT